MPRPATPERGRLRRRGSTRLQGRSGCSRWRYLRRLLPARSRTASTPASARRTSTVPSTIRARSAPSHRRKLLGRQDAVGVGIEGREVRSGTGVAHWIPQLAPLGHSGGMKGTQLVRSDRAVAVLIHGGKRRRPEGGRGRRLGQHGSNGHKAARGRQGQQFEQRLHRMSPRFGPSRYRPPGGVRPGDLGRIPFRRFLIINIRRTDEFTLKSRREAPEPRGRTGGGELRRAREEVGFHRCAAGSARRRGGRRDSRSGRK